MTKVLLIDDSIFTLHRFAEMAQNLGCQVVTADSGAEGVRLFAQEKPQLVLCDLMMPEMDGFEVLAEINKLKVASKTVFLFVTADIQHNTEKKALELGAQGVVAKPLTEAILREVLKKYGKQ